MMLRALHLHMHTQVCINGRLGPCIPMSSGVPLVKSLVNNQQPLPSCLFRAFLEQQPGTGTPCSPHSSNNNLDLPSLFFRQRQQPPFLSPPPRLFSKGRPVSRGALPCRRRRLTCINCIFFAFNPPKAHSSVLETTYSLGFRFTKMKRDSVTVFFVFPCGAHKASTLTPQQQQQ